MHVAFIVEAIKPWWDMAAGSLWKHGQLERVGLAPGASLRMEVCSLLLGTRVIVWSWECPASPASRSFPGTLS